ncbi:hypothetical protein [Pseudoxanthomonas indica]|uniref:Uncharacterized protein n=1 Tax=Pseudoxanthomonas indica TaxID=428993 RepID=A0A1T5J2U6_9GAMM|nr:hypothetical protein [Pseudoxanthomonas indica]SKC45730.1 hypothetical protein SAMN06296058_0474 [Pseudoxanthomonas indica]
MRIVAGVVVMLLIVYGLGRVPGIGPEAASSVDVVVAYALDSASPLED